MTFCSSGGAGSAIGIDAYGLHRSCEHFNGALQSRDFFALCRDTSIESVDQRGV
jgi:hypothetical protein